MKTSDISTRQVLSACNDFHSGKSSASLLLILMEQTKAPEKVIYSALDREVKAGNIDYGTTIRCAFLTDKGVSKLKEFGI